MEPAAPSPFSLLPPRGSRVAGGDPACLAGTADLPSAVPATYSPPSLQPRVALIETLRRSIGKIERPVLARGERQDLPSRNHKGGGGSPWGWRLGGAGSAHPLLACALETDCVHEVKPAARAAGASAGDWMASLGFALRLGVIRLAQVDGGSARGGKGAILLWCWPRIMARELGRPSWHGLAALGLDPSRLLIVETAREAEALAAMEEGLRSGAVALALGVFEEIALNPARRLSLAAGGNATPALLLTHPSRAPAAATSTRWRIARAPSAAHPFDPRAPGASRFSAALERCRAAPQSAGLPPLVLEWSNETHAFGVASGLADRADEPRRAGRGAGA